MQLLQFEFEIVTIDRRGDIDNRETKQASYFTQTIPLTGEEENGEVPVTLDMISIPGGNFMMGSPENELESHANEKPQHKVSVKPFFMGKYPITYAQWKEIASREDLRVEYDLDPHPAGFNEFKDRNRHPVERIYWYDAVEFCQRLSKLTGEEYRLPSEAEWEYACRAGTQTPFHFGETITPKLAKYNPINTYASERRGKSSNQTIIRVGSFPVGNFYANNFGLYDMHGQVWEWCEDDWHESYQDAPTDGSAWLSEKLPETDTYKVLRGGSWFSKLELCRSTSRLKFSPNTVNIDLGFRVVCN